MNTFKVIKKEFKSDNVFVVRVERSEEVIKAGQCFNVGLPGLGINREYSMFSGANESHLDFLIRSVEGGRVSQRLKEIQAGDLVEVDGPYGEFCLDPKKMDDEYLFVATGTGIAPFHSFVKTYPLLKYKIFHGVRYPTEVLKEDIFGENYMPCISRSDDGKSFRVTDALKKLEFQKNLRIYLCGNRNMIIESVDILLSTGFSGSQIYTEVFF